MRLFAWILELLFPPKCVLCRDVLGKEELDLCRACRRSAPEFTRRDKIRYITGFTAVWHYEGNVRASLLRYKFHNARSYAPAYGRLAAMKVRQTFGDKIDAITWVPVSAKRRRKRGYDQVELIARAVGAELELPVEPMLTKARDNKPNSSLETAEERRANVLGVYRTDRPDVVRGRRILLMDDILTTGATASECARTLLNTGAKDVYCAAVAAGRNKNK